MRPVRRDVRQADTPSSVLKCAMGGTSPAAAVAFGARIWQRPDVIASVQFKHFKALRATSLRLEAFNLLIGPSGSGKTSLIQALLRLRALARQPAAVQPPAAGPPVPHKPNDAPEIIFRFTPPNADIEVHLRGQSEKVCDVIEVRHPPGDGARARWAALRTRLDGIRAYLFDHYAMAGPVPPSDGVELASNGRNLGAVLARLREQHPDTFSQLEAEFCRELPDFSGVVPQRAESGVTLALRFREDGQVLTAENLSQGALYTLAILTLSFSVRPPAMVCLEEADRGIHPRLLREVRDALYRLCYPADSGARRDAVQIVATTQSPFFLDLFRDHPEEVVIANKRGRSATFARLSDRPDVRELLAEGSLGDIWFSGILGGVPEE
jgi:energy-coupling factor transporter ATP-binding protein EcfA2